MLIPGKVHPLATQLSYIPSYIHLYDNEIFNKVFIATKHGIAILTSEKVITISLKLGMT